MKLKCTINGTEYDIVEGASFSDNYNETLDSGSIVIDQVLGRIPLKPYDDVFVYSVDSGDTQFAGYYNKGDVIQTSVSVSGPVIDQPSTPSCSTPLVGNDGLTPSSPLITIHMLGGSWQAANATYNIAGPIPAVWLMYLMDYTSSTEGDFPYLNVPTVKFSADIAVAVISGGSITYNTYSGVTFTLRAESSHASGGIAPAIYFDATAGGTSISIEASISSDYSYVSIPAVNKFNDGALQVQIRSASVDLTTARIEPKDLFKRDFTLSSEGITTEGKIRLRFLGQWVTPTVTWTEASVSDTYFIGLSYKSHTSTITLVKASGASVYSGTFRAHTGGAYYDDFFGYVDDIEIYYTTKISDEYKALPTFYKHLLVNSFSEDRLSLKPDANSYPDDANTMFKYTINLFSETKKLEKIILPNISITQSLESEKKRSCWFYLESFVNLYSPKYKKVLNATDGTWHYVQKYSVSDTTYSRLEGHNGIVTDLKSVFEGTVCPEMSLNNPSLKDLITQIMRVKDIIPIVFNDVIYGLDIGKTSYSAFSRTGIGFDTGSMSSATYATDARREYSGAISQESSAHMVEYLGFRTQNNAFLTLSDMVLETRFPIYKINKIVMCYYKPYTVTTGLVSEVKAFLCEFDMTPLVLQNVVRNALSTNYEAFGQETEGEWVVDYSNLTGSIENKLSQIAHYKLCTVGYDIGSNVISGWGVKYEYLRYLWFKESKTYIENMINLLENVSDIGTQIYNSELQTQPGTTITVGVGSADNIIPFDNQSNNNISNKLKSIVFKVDYDAMYSGAIMHDKDNIDSDDIVTADNCSSSLTVLESDGIFEKETMNRMSNETYRFTARYDRDNMNGKSNVTAAAVQELATLDPVSNAIIYKREYQIYDNVILANYEAAEEYVMKNYFTSVWAKYRTYSLMSYGESVNRAENMRQLIMLNKGKRYYETDNVIGGSFDALPWLMSFITASPIDQYGRIKTDEMPSMNCAYFTFPSGNYLSDINCFATGNSVCFNLITFDNVSGGMYINSMDAKLKAVTGWEDLLDYKTTQGWWQMVADATDAFTESVGIYVCHLDTDALYIRKATTASAIQNTSGKFKNLPKLDSTYDSYTSKKLGGDFKLLKDNKERLDVTFQYSFICGPGMVMSPWAPKLCDMVGTYRKIDDNNTVIVNYSSSFAFDLYMYQQSNDASTKDFILKIKETDLAILRNEFITDNNPKAMKGQTATCLLYSYYPEGLYLYYAGDAYLTANSVTSCDTSNTIPDSIGLYLTLNGIEERTKLKTNPFSQDEVTKKLLVRNITFTLSHNTTSVESGVTYHFYTATVGNGYWDSGTLGSTHPYGTGMRGPSQITAVDSDNSNDLKAEISYSSNEVVPLNMVLIKSTSSLTPTSQYDSFELTTPSSVGSHAYYDLPDDMFIDTPGLYMSHGTGSGTLVSSGHLVPEVFSLQDDGTLTVNPSDFASDSAGTIKSLRYFYKDDKGWLHFVFGVDVATPYQSFNIYPSCVSKRDMSVYDSDHVKVGSAEDYLSSSSSHEYGTGQYYKED